MTQQHNSPPAPVSKTVQRLLAQIHTEVEAAIMAALSAKDGIVTLRPMPAVARRIDSYAGCRGHRISGSDGSSVILVVTHKQTDHNGVALQGPRWSAYTELMDGQGNTWTRHHGYGLITDDFGNLVTAKGGAS